MVTASMLSIVPVRLRLVWARLDMNRLITLSVMTMTLTLSVVRVAQRYVTGALPIVYMRVKARGVTVTKTLSMTRETFVHSPPPTVLL